MTLLFTTFLLSPILNVNAKQICEHVPLYPYTFQPGKPEHIILCHPDSATEKKDNEANIALDNGILSAQHHPTLIKCPSADKNSAYCQGWSYAKRYGPGGP